VKTWSPLAIGAVAAAGGILISVGTITYLKLRRRKDPAELERLRRLALGRTGRITSGEITGIIEPEDGRTSPLLIAYRYDIAGVTYEVTQDVSAMPAVAAEASRLIGRTISVKYDTRHPTNSIIACEEWSGIRSLKLNGLAGNTPTPTPAGPANKP
jgi:hypothetical protein